MQIPIYAYKMVIAAAWNKPQSGGIDELICLHNISTYTVHCIVHMQSLVQFALVI